jgi:hypothetical protein
MPAGPTAKMAVLQNFSRLFVPVGPGGCFVGELLVAQKAKRGVPQLPDAALIQFSSS